MAGVKTTSRRRSSDGGRSVCGPSDGGRGSKGNTGDESVGKDVPNREGNTGDESVGDYIADFVIRRPSRSKKNTLAGRDKGPLRTCNSFLRSQLGKRRLIVKVIQKMSLLGKMFLRSLRRKLKRSTILIKDVGFLKVLLRSQLEWKKGLACPTREDDNEELIGSSNIAKDVEDHHSKSDDDEDVENKGVEDKVMCDEVLSEIQPLSNTELPNVNCTNEEDKVERIEIDENAQPVLAMISRKDFENYAKRSIG
ncbi:hypothetical protein BVRB_4g094350 [Beta vulgaris subsp. vulgaris]|nr:hypothetical protein BVRB_4g094350 [Beta vulgaris subsp. vulgaris]